MSLRKHSISNAVEGVCANSRFLSSAKKKGNLIAVRLSDQLQQTEVIDNFIAVRLSDQLQQTEVIDNFYFSSSWIQEFFQRSRAKQVELDNLAELLYSLNIPGLRLFTDTRVADMLIFTRTFRLSRTGPQVRAGGESAVRRILVFQLARFGDLVQSKRLLLSLAAEQNSEVHLCLDQSLLPLARLLYPFATAHGIPAHRTDAGDFFSACRKTFALFRELDFSSVCFLNFSPLSFACAALFPPEKVIGYARVDGQDMRSKLSGLTFNLLRDRRFSPVNLADLWAFCHTSPIAPEKVNPIAHPASSGRIGIVASARAPRRSLSPQILADCVRAVFQARGGPEMVCLGTAEETPSARALKRELPARCAEKFKDLTGKTALADLPDILRGLDALLTPDTGIMHLAAHHGVPVQAFFLSSAWCFETGPYGMGHSVWQAREACSPCLERSPCPRKIACLRAFSHPSFLARLAGRYREGWPENLLGLVTTPDNLGMVCKTVDGVDPCAKARAQLRSGLAECLGLPGSESHPMGKDTAGFLFGEKDWMLPGDWKNAAFREHSL